MGALLGDREEESAGSARIAAMNDNDPLERAKRALKDIDFHLEEDRAAGRAVSASPQMLLAMIHGVYGAVQWAESAEKRLRALEAHARQ